MTQDVRTWTIGEARITQIVEQVLPKGLPGFIPEATPEALLSIDWLSPHFITPDGDASISIHGFVVEASGLTVLVDTCVGEGKDMPMMPGWTDVQISFLEKLETSGFQRDRIDYVICTHLHLDHVGWNTIKVDEQWMPTFPNARYLVSQTEFDAFNADLNDPHTSEFHRQMSIAVERESLRPLMEAGLIELVSMDHRLSSDIRLVPTAGHTPGHVSVLVESGGDSAIITGDAAHHPCQLAHPEWSTIIDVSPATSADTRWSMFAEAAVTNRLVLGTHWTGPAGGTVVGDDRGYRLIY